MKLPVNFVLYLATAGLLGYAGWTFYQAHQESRWEDYREKEHTKAMNRAQDLLAKGKGQGGQVESINYQSTLWKGVWMAPNVLGKDPPKPVDPELAVQKEPEPEVDMTPLEDIIELVSLIHDETAQGEGGESHVIVRYRDTADVEPPRWYELENQPQASGGMGRALPRGDAMGNARRGRNRGGRPRGGRPATPAPATPAPMSTAGAEIVQRIWVAGDGSKKFEATLWPPYEHIRLVRVEADAKSAWFVRTLPPEQAGGEPRTSEREQLIKSSLNLPQDLLREIALLQKRDADRMLATTGGPVQDQGTWQDVEETTRIDGVWHLGRKDQKAFTEDEDSFISSIHVDAYRSSTGSNLRGLQVMNVSSEIQRRFGVQQGELILALNGQPVSTKAQAINLGKKLYKRGVRRFTVTFLSNGQEIERTYQAPEQ